MFRQDADLLLASFDSFTRAAQLTPDQADGQDPEAVKDEILGEVKDQLGWDGKSGNPNDSVAALEDALADIFNADVEITWDGTSTLTLKVEGEDPVQLTPDYLGTLLEQLAKGEDGEDAPVEQRGFDSDWRRAGVEDAHHHLHAPKGKFGGRFVSKGGAVGAVESAVGKAAKAGGGKGHNGRGPDPASLARRAQGRGGPRATAKAVGSALSAGTGSRVRVSGNKDGTFNVGPKKRKMSGRAVGALMVALWSASAVAGGFLVLTAGLPAGVAIGPAIAAGIGVVKLIRG